MTIRFRAPAQPTPATIGQPTIPGVDPRDPRPTIVRDVIRKAVEAAPQTNLWNGEIPQPNLLESSIPIIGPAWEAGYDLQQGDYAGAAFNGAMAVADGLPVSPLLKLRKVVKILQKAEKYRNGEASADRLRRWYTKYGQKGVGEELHHTIPLNGASRKATGDFRNNPFFLKVMPQAEHRRLTGSWKGEPQYDWVRRQWYGTNALEKTIPAAGAAMAADSFENLSRAPEQLPDRRRRP